jgi:cytochrome c
MRLILVAAFILTPIGAMASDDDLLKAGEKVFKKCKACHKVGEGAKHGVGPILNNILDQPAGAQSAFNYSAAMMTAAENGLVWDEASLAAFLKRPRDFVSGTKMSFSGLRKSEDVDAILALLRSHSTPE